MFKLLDISQSRYYWLLYILGSTGLLAVALYYQHALDEQPCLMCIQVRLLISLLIVIAVAGLLFRSRKWLHLLSNLSVILVAAALTERSYMLLGTERGFVFSDCSFDLGLPAWLALDQWFPWLYQVETTCGYTPELVLGITMAEALLVLSSGLVLLSVYALLASLLQGKKTAC